MATVEATAEGPAITAPDPAAPLYPPAPRFAALDAFRAVGALMVMGTHVAFVTGRTQAGPLSALFGRLDAGVAVFFVLSGFLLFRPYAAAAAGAGRSVSTRRYLIRRAFRILPAYWLLVVASFLLLPENDDVTTGDWLRHLTLTQIYHSDELRQGIGQAWSLCTEVVFYLLLPLLAATVLWRRKGRPWQPGRAVALLALTVPIGVGWLITREELQDQIDPYLSSLWLPAYAAWFGAGMALAVVHVALTQGRTGRWRGVADLGAAPLACWSIAVCLLAVATTPLAGPRSLEASTNVWEPIIKMLLYTGFATFLLLPAIFHPKDGRVTVLLLESRPLSYLGKVSYGLFLWHLLVLEGIRHVLDIPLFTGSMPLLFTQTLAVTLVVAVVSFHVVEQPLQRLSTRATRQNRTSPRRRRGRRVRESA
jgi:peptidoglycan/LPS O-acetylase OafA/YrhL